MKIKSLRLNLNKTQEEVAKELNMQRTKYARYETEESKMSTEQLIQIADYFDVSLDYLCDRQWNNKVGYIPESKTELINDILSLNDNETKELMIFIRGLKAGRSSSSDFKIFN